MLCKTGLQDELITSDGLPMLSTFIKYSNRACSNESPSISTLFASSSNCFFVILILTCCDASSQLVPNLILLLSPIDSALLIILVVL
ncbi:hypothetical protein Scep_012960 [Stephania cephalantha]|uniref:Uncharacterized protein n=1 Tax=Stephania cephalantha TaxID=152367 RepID=A0AAP0P6Y6_9MAGN